MEKTKRLYWPDLLRIAASFFVVLIHVTAVGINVSAIGSSVWTWSTALGSVCRWAVPVFFMISGMFLLDPEKDFDVKRFFKKNVVRIAAAALVFGLLYACLDRVMAGDFSLKAAAVVLYYTLFGKAGYHLWYLFTLLVLYAFTPVLRVFTAHADKKQLDLALLLWFVLTVLFGQIDLLAGSILHVEGLMPFEPVVLTGFSGFYLLGYRLKKYPLGKKALVWVTVSAAAALCVMPAATVFFGQKLQVQALDAFNSHLGLGSCLAAVALFSLVSRAKVGERAGKALSFIGAHTFGVYLWHVLFVTLFFRVFSFGLDVLTPLALLGYSVLVWVCAFAVTALMRLIPGLRRLV